MMKLIAQIIIAFVLILYPVSSIAFEIPKDIKLTANKISFLASLAKRCNISLEIQGKVGLADNDCVQFSNKMVPVMEEFVKKEELLLMIAKEVDESESFLEKRRFNSFFDEIQKNSGTIIKVRQHIDFLND